MVDLVFAVGRDHTAGGEGFGSSCLVEIVTGSQGKTRQHEALEVYSEQVKKVLDWAHVRILAPFSFSCDQLVDFFEKQQDDGEDDFDFDEHDDGWFG